VVKKVVFLIIASLLVIGLVIPGCAGEGGGGEGGGEDTRPSITFAIAGAMNDVTGKHALWGAELARDEINKGAGVNVDGVYHKIELKQVDTNEVSGTPDEGVTALQAVIDDVDFVLGGWQLQNVVVYREVAMDAQKIFMDCGVAAGILQGSVVTNYNRYKYWFKVTPQNEFFLLSSLFKIMGTFTGSLKDKLIAAGDTVLEEYRLSEESQVRVAIISEDAAWCSGLVILLEGQARARGYDVVGSWKVSPTATDISAELTEIEGKHPHIIIPVFWGLVGTVYSVQKANLGIPAITIGFNQPDVEKSHWADTGGKCNGEIMLVDTWAEGLENTAKTTAFFNAFVAKTGEYPFYTAATYDTILSLKVAIEAVSAANGWKTIAKVVDPANIDVLIKYMEDPSHAYTGSAAKTAWYPMPEAGNALSEAQVRALYPDLATYVQSQWLVASSAMAGAHIAHDTVYGPGYETRIGSQWQDGKKVGVWPVDLGDAYDAALTDQYGCWNFEYPGTVDVLIPIEGFLAS
jgi:branched-chain amino acid transport system substrate-binding protein